DSLSPHNPPAPPPVHTLSLHDALPISRATLAATTSPPCPSTAGATSATAAGATSATAAGAAPTGTSGPATASASSGPATATGSTTTARPLRIRHGHRRIGCEYQAHARRNLSCRSTI